MTTETTRVEVGQSEARVNGNLLAGSGAGSTVHPPRAHSVEQNDSSAILPPDIACLSQITNPVDSDPLGNPVLVQKLLNCYYNGVATISAPFDVEWAGPDMIWGHGFFSPHSSTAFITTERLYTVFESSNEPPIIVDPPQKTQATLRRAVQDFPLSHQLWHGLEEQRNQRASRLLSDPFGLVQLLGLSNEESPQVSTKLVGLARDLISICTGNVDTMEISERDLYYPFQSQGESPMYQTEEFKQSIRKIALTAKEDLVERLLPFRQTGIEWALNDGLPPVYTSSEPLQPGKVGTYPDHLNRDQRIDLVRSWLPLELEGPAGIPWLHPIELSNVQQYTRDSFCQKIGLHGPQPVCQLSPIRWCNRLVRNCLCST